MIDYIHGLIDCRTQGPVSCVERSLILNFTPQPNHEESEHYYMRDRGRDIQADRGRDRQIHRMTHLCKGLNCRRSRTSS
jgi:hypothetical protein